MPREDRRISFENEEVYKALYALCIQKQVKKPPPGVVVGVREDEKDNNIVYVDFENPLEKTRSKEEYSRDFVAAALMVFCRGLGIPLPKKAQKSVLISNGQLILRVTI